MSFRNLMWLWCDLTFVIYRFYLVENKFLVKFLVKMGNDSYSKTIFEKWQIVYYQGSKILKNTYPPSLYMIMPSKFKSFMLNLTLLGKPQKDFTATILPLNAPFHCYNWFFALCYADLFVLQHFTIKLRVLYFCVAVIMYLSSCLTAFHCDIYCCLF